MARYFLRFRHSDTGLAPSFLTFKKVSDLSAVIPPGITDVGAPAGSYYFDFTPTFDIVFEVDGGASIPTEEVRYISDMIGPKDTYVDEPTSQVKDDVWNDTVDRAVTTKGDAVEKLVGVETSLSDIKGAGFNTAVDSLKILSDNIDLIAISSGGLPSAAAVASAVWDKPTASHVLAGSFGLAVGTGSSPPSAVTIANTVWDTALALHLTAGTTGAKLNSASGLTGPQTAAAVWDALTASYTAVNSFGARADTDSNNIKRSLGMLHENSVLDNTTFTVDNNLLTGRMRIYNSKANADAAEALSISLFPASSTYNTGKIAEYAVVATYTGTNLKTYKVSLEP